MTLISIRLLEEADFPQWIALRAELWPKEAPAELAGSYHEISRRTIFSPSMVKAYRRSIGLPGKSPETRPLTIILPSVSAASMTSTVGRYFLLTSSAHSRMAEVPWRVRPSSRTTAPSLKQAVTASASWALAPAT